jgi:hypothetical protein
MPRATATAPPIMCRIWWSMKDSPHTCAAAVASGERAIVGVEG